jgi:NAD(P)-dependent dehydrogenase (short-subunit alcohol dehydrogenase family)
MSTVLISGAASGLGKAFLERFVQSAEFTTIIAVDRSPINGVEDERVQYLDVDVSSTQSITNLAQQLRDVPIHLCIHSAGIRGLVPSVEAQHPDDVARAETIEAMDSDTMMRTFQINTAGTFLLIQALLPNFDIAKKTGTQAKVVVIGSRMGSISYNTTGGSYAYRASKAGLNAVMKSFSIDVQDVIFTVLHPGRVETALVKCREEGAIEPKESVDEMMKVIDTLTIAESGKFYDRFGQVIGW